MVASLARIEAQEEVDLAGNRLVDRQAFRPTESECPARTLYDIAIRLGLCGR
jgi:hypothetical protein